MDRISEEHLHVTSCYLAQTFAWTQRSTDDNLDGQRSKVKVVVTSQNSLIRHLFSFTCRNSTLYLNFTLFQNVKHDSRVCVMWKCHVCSKIDEWRPGGLQEAPQAASHLLVMSHLQIQFLTSVVLSLL